MTTSLEKLNKKIISCKKCKRLVSFREKIATEKRKKYIDNWCWRKYWYSWASGRPTSLYFDRVGTLEVKRNYPSVTLTKRATLDF